MRKGEAKPYVAQVEVYRSFASKAEAEQWMISTSESARARCGVRAEHVETHLWEPATDTNHEAHHGTDARNG
jgi:hypothetical protein